MIRRTPENVDKKNTEHNKSVRWTLVVYDIVVYGVVAVILLGLYGGMDKLSPMGIIQQVALSAVCIFAARLIGNGRYGDMVVFSVTFDCFLQM